MRLITEEEERGHHHHKHAQGWTVYAHDVWQNVKYSAEMRAN